MGCRRGGALGGGPPEGSWQNRYVHVVGVGLSSVIGRTLSGRRYRISRSRLCPASIASGGRAPGGHRAGWAALGGHICEALGGVPLEGPPPVVRQAWRRHVGGQEVGLAPGGGKCAGPRTPARGLGYAPPPSTCYQDVVAFF